MLTCVAEPQPADAFRPAFCDRGHRIYLARDLRRELLPTAAATDGIPDLRGYIRFTAHLNPPGTWIDLGKVATDGSAKIQRGHQRLIVFPYPRDKRFRVSLDLEALARSADSQHLQVLALAAGTQQPLGAADFAWENGRLMQACPSGGGWGPT